ncbi:MAG: hypothetical protein HGA47_03930 [Zoogloea sp.]|nr:hypothetical protein [Zoogloea sp.]
MNRPYRFLLFLFFAFGVFFTVMTDTMQDAQQVCMESADIILGDDCASHAQAPDFQPGSDGGDGEHLPLPSTRPGFPAMADADCEALPAPEPDGIIPDVVTPPPRLA